jgi:hypothetical protein
MTFYEAIIFRCHEIWRSMSLANVAPKKMTFFQIKTRLKIPAPVILTHHKTTPACTKPFQGSKLPQKRIHLDTYPGHHLFRPGLGPKQDILSRAALLKGDLLP